MKKDIIIIDKKAEFKHLSQVNPAITTTIASLGHLNLLAFYF